MNYKSAHSRVSGATLLPARLLLLAAISGVAGAANAALPAEIKSGDAAYGVMSTAAPASLGTEYKIGIQDTVSVNIFQEEQLSVNNAEVDTAGNLTLPLIGPVAAAGKTTDELSALIAKRLSPNYLKNPQVSVTVGSSASQKVIVEGEVNKPGTYAIKGGTTLLETLALAGGETRTAALNKVIVFRSIDGKRTGAAFDIKAIRSGKAVDPSILASDIVVVDYSKGRRLWDDILRTMPLINMLTL
jgi:polysaccharide export outer membrane protein